MTRAFEVGDKVRVDYFHDANPHNGQIGTIKWLHNWNYYPDGDFSRAVQKTQGMIEYEDGRTEAVNDFYHEGERRVQLVSETEGTT